MSEERKTSTDTGATKMKKSRVGEAFFLATVAGVSIIGGFGFTIAMAKKKDPQFFFKGIAGGGAGLPESGGSLALKALGWGTLYSLTGCSLFALGVCKLMGVNSMEDFRNQVQRKMPAGNRNEPQGRTQFDSLQDLVDYILHEDRKSKMLKEALESTESNR